jgi:lipoprotein-releasing system ATP-binding protein
MNNFLQCLNLYKSFSQGTKSQVQALRGVDFSVEKGEFLSIAGPSGAGKSTLLHLLGGLDEPNRGTVKLEGRDIFKMNGNERATLRLKKIGFVFQFYHLLPEFTALENVILPIYMNRRLAKKEAEKKATALLKEVGLDNRLLQKPAELSGGEAQRVAIARALILEPELILCDEPTGNLDSETGQMILELLVRINKEKGKTFIIVSHDENIAERAERILHIKDGVIRS